MGCLTVIIVSVYIGEKLNQLDWDVKKHGKQGINNNKKVCKFL